MMMHPDIEYDLVPLEDTTLGMGGLGTPTGMSHVYGPGLGIGGPPEGEAQFEAAKAESLSRTVRWAPYAGAALGGSILLGALWFAWRRAGYAQSSLEKKRLDNAEIAAKAAAEVSIAEAEARAVTAEKAAEVALERAKNEIERMKQSQSNDDADAQRKVFLAEQELALMDASLIVNKKVRKDAQDEEKKDINRFKRSCDSCIDIVAKVVALRKVYQSDVRKCDAIKKASSKKTCERQAFIVFRRGVQSHGGYDGLSTGGIFRDSTGTGVNCNGLRTGAMVDGKVTTCAGIGKPFARPDVTPFAGRDFDQWWMNVLKG